MANNEWQQDPTVLQWFKMLNNERTTQNYKDEFPRFLQFVKMEPKDIVQQRLEQLATTDSQKRRFWEDKFVEFKHSLENEGKRVNTIKGYLRTTRSFFTYSGVKLQLTRNDTKIRPQSRMDLVPKTEWIPSNEEIRVLYRMAQNARDRAILLTLYQSGFSEVDIASMQIEDFPEFYDENGNWQVPITEDLYHQNLRSKTSASEALQQTCISREALEEIRIMLQSRGYPKQGYLFVSFRDEPLKVRGINEIFVSTQGRTGLVEKAFNGKAKEWKTRYLRDAFMNACERAKIPQKIADIMAGHKPDGAKSNYAVQKETIETLYKDVFKFLTINGYGSQSRKLEELNDQVQQLNMQNAVLMQMLGTVVTPEQMRLSILKAAKTLPNMNDEKLQAIENSLKMVKSVDELQSGLQNVMKVYGGKTKTEQ